ncbi:hypothetical protein [Saccharospirillum mangrovi]|uniref:hypothetical protein n=1 Tax=Saccharospirillum mangrovi TaxID=2161747 RepID=UPI000D39B913|nr:hypothetical protein [Saccharospirillum mangrovi]
MRRVPQNRLMVQPTVHRDWFQRAGALCFELDDATADDFAQLWQAFENEGRPAPTDFLNRYPLSENDALFALFATVQLLLETEADLDVQPQVNSLILSRAKR